MYRPRVYVSGPITGGDRVDNVITAVNIYHKLIDRGFAPLCPHLSCFAEYLGVRLDHQTWIDIDLPWVGVSDAVLRLEGDSKGGDMEVAFALKHKIPVFRTLGALQDWKAVTFGD